jgi:hypothetical protein
MHAVVGRKRILKRCAVLTREACPTWIGKIPENDIFTFAGANLPALASSNSPRSRRLLATF